MNEAIAPVHIVWAEQGGHDPSVRFDTPPRHWKAQGTPWSADSTKSGSWALADMDSLASLLRKAVHTPTFSCIGQTNLSPLRKLKYHNHETFIFLPKSVMALKHS